MMGRIRVIAMEDGCARLRAVATGHAGASA